MNKLEKRFDSWLLGFRNRKHSLHKTLLFVAALFAAGFIAGNLHRLLVA